MNGIDLSEVQTPNIEHVLEMELENSSTQY